MDVNGVASTALKYNAASAAMNQGMNMVNQSNPFGSTSYKQSGTQTITGPDGKTKITVPTYSQETTLSPETQKLFNSQYGSALQKFGQYASQGQFNGNQAMEDKISSLQRSRLDPYWQNQKEQFDASMAGQGIAPGSAAYKDAYSNFSQGQNDAYNSMWLGAHNDAYNQAVADYERPLQEAQSLQQSMLGLSPQFGSVPQAGVNGVDYASLVSSNNANKTAASNGQWGALGSLGGSLISGLF